MRGLARELDDPDPRLMIASAPCEFYSSSKRFLYDRRNSCSDRSGTSSRCPERFRVNRKHPSRKKAAPARRIRENRAPRASSAIADLKCAAITRRASLPGSARHSGRGQGVAISSGLVRARSLFNHNRCCGDGDGDLWPEPDPRCDGLGFATRVDPLNQAIMITCRQPPLQDARRNAT